MAVSDQLGDRRTGDDRFFPREHGRRLAELLPQGRFELVEGSRTFIPEDNPQRLVALLRDFVAGASDPRNGT